MITTQTLDLPARRWVGFSYRIDITGLDGADVVFARMDVRNRKDEPGDPIIRLELGSWGDDNAIAFLTDNSGDDPVATLRIEIDETTMQTLVGLADAVGLEAGSDVELVYDIQLQTVVLPRDVWFEGKFIVKAGVSA